MVGAQHGGSVRLKIMADQTNACPVAVVLLNFNGWRDTLACVDSLLNSKCGFRTLVICDNASTDDSMAELRKGLVERQAQIAETWESWWGIKAAASFLELGGQEVEQTDTIRLPIALLNTGANWGFAKGNNFGLRLALKNPQISYFWLLNNDTIVPESTISTLWAECQQRPDLGLVGATVIYHHHPEMVQALCGGALNRRTAETRHVGAFLPVSEVKDSKAFVGQVESEIDYVLGASMWATRAWVEKVGVLGESYFLYYEEMDWAIRGQPYFEIGYAPKAIVYHKEGASIGTDPNGGSPFSVFHLFRSKMIFSINHLPKYVLPAVLMSSFVRAAKWVLKGRAKLAVAAVKGIASGLEYRAVTKDAL
jgi:GT2 family glycosyltransferase